MGSSIVGYDEIENAKVSLVSVSATAIELSATRLGRARRSFFSIVPVTSGVTVTVVPANIELNQVVANAGTPLQPNQPYSESAQSGSKVWQGPIYVIASGSGQVAFNERFEVDE